MYYHMKLLLIFRKYRKRYFLDNKKRIKNTTFLENQKLRNPLFPMVFGLFVCINCQRRDCIPILTTVNS